MNPIRILCENPGEAKRAQALEAHLREQIPGLDVAIAGYDTANQLDVEALVLAEKLEDFEAWKTTAEEIGQRGNPVFLLTYTQPGDPSKKHLKEKEEITGIAYRWAGEYKGFTADEQERPLHELLVEYLN